MFLKYKDAPEIRLCGTVFNRLEVSLCPHRNGGMCGNGNPAWEKSVKEDFRPQCTWKKGAEDFAKP